MNYFRGQRPGALIDFAISGINQDQIHASAKPNLPPPLVPCGFICDVYLSNDSLIDF